MPLYGFRCPQCNHEFEVSRKMSEASNPAMCPVDGTTSDRIFTAPVKIGQRGGDAAPAPSQGPQTPAGDAVSHFGHSHGHGAGSHGHSHGHSHGGPIHPAPPTT